MVANGVLVARDMGGGTAERLATRATARRGELFGLDLAVTGTISAPVAGGRRPGPAVLRAATTAVAKLCRLDARYGAVAPGKVASLVLVRKNPLDDVRHAGEIEAVLARGRYFDRQALDGLPSDAKTDAIARTPSKVAPALAPPGESVARGSYRLTYQQYDAGTEEFAIARRGDTIRSASVVRQGEWELPYRVDCEYAADGGAPQATRTTLTERPSVVEYAVRAGELAARPGGERFAFGPASLLDCGAAGMRAVALRLADLGVGAERRVEWVALRDAERRPECESRVAKRLADARPAGGPVCRVYEICPIQGDAEVITIWAGDGGVPERVERRVSSLKRAAVRVRTDSPKP